MGGVAGARVDDRDGAGRARAVVRNLDGVRPAIDRDAAAEWVVAYHDRRRRLDASGRPVPVAGPRVVRVLLPFQSGAVARLAQGVQGCSF